MDVQRLVAEGDQAAQQRRRRQARDADDAQLHRHGRIQGPHDAAERAAVKFTRTRLPGRAVMPAGSA
jgi:hypothetical protein